MSRFYVKNKEGKWNIFSSVIDNFVYPDFLPFYILKDLVLMSDIRDVIEDKEAELETLLTEKPMLNVMSYEEAMESRRTDEDDEDEE